MGTLDVRLEFIVRSNGYLALEVTEGAHAAEAVLGTECRAFALKEQPVE
jgi:hypothetical protein